MRVDMACSAGIVSVVWMCTEGRQADRTDYRAASVWQIEMRRTALPHSFAVRLECHSLPQMVVGMLSY